MAKFKYKNLIKQLLKITPRQIDNFDIDIGFDIQEKIIYIGNFDTYGKYSEEKLYVPFNDKKQKITISNIDDSYNELKKYYFDVVEKQKKYTNYRGGYFGLNLFVKDGKTGEVLAYFSYRDIYLGIKYLLEKICKDKYGILFDLEEGNDFYEDDIIIFRIDDSIYILVGAVYPDIEIIQEDILSFVKIDAKQYFSKIKILKEKAEEIMENLINDLDKDYWNITMNWNWKFREIVDWKELLKKHHEL